MNARQVQTPLLVAFDALFVAVGAFVLSKFQTVSDPYGQRILVVAGVICVTMGVAFFALCLDGRSG